MRARAGVRERERDSAANGASLASRSFQKAEESSEHAAEKGDAFFFLL